MSDFAPPQLQSVPLRMKIADAMRRGIVLSELVPGERLDETSLAGKFGVSRIPIREAFALLERDGLVRSEPRRGTYVVGLTDEDIHDIYEFRRMIEMFAIREVTLKIGADGLTQLRSLVEETEAAMHAHQSERMAEKDLEFHRCLVALAGNKRSLSAWEMIGDLVAVFLSINSSMFRDLPRSGNPIDEHRHSKLFHLIEARDAAAAELLLRDHLLSSEMVIRESIKRIRARAHMPQPDRDGASADGATRPRTSPGAEIASNGDESA